MDFLGGNFQKVVFESLHLPNKAGSGTTDCAYFYFEGCGRKPVVRVCVRICLCVCERSRHVLTVHRCGLSECLDGAGRTAAAGRMGTVHRDDGSEDLPAV